jgi:uncharacterized membrane protein YdbT with pleckstrin-like domain
MFKQIVKGLGAALISAVVLFAFYEVRVKTAMDHTKKQAERIKILAEERKEEYRIESDKNKEELKAREEARLNAEIVKVFVRAKDARTCMKELKSKEINNLVIECNKDHYIELRRDEAEAIKEKENERL